MPVINVLIFPAGEVNSVELHDALSSCVNICVYGASSIDRHGPYIFENYISGLPMITDDHFIEAFNDILKEKNIDVVFPTHDTVAMFFSENIDKFSSKIIVYDKNTAKICRDKKLTYKYFHNEVFLPKIYDTITSYPVFIKPRMGQGAVGAKKIDSEMDCQDIDFNDYVICEYLPGEEYTVDCFTDNQGNLRFISPRSRSRIMAGISVSGKDEELTSEISYIATTINSKLKFLGLWWFQIKKDIKDAWKLLEISTRCAGTMSLTRARGVNLPLLSVYTAMGYPVHISENKYHVQMDSTLIRRYKIDYYYQNVYFDFDDTIIVRGKVNLKAICFLYQCNNYGKNIILITRHDGDLFEIMNMYHINRDLFTYIIHIDLEDKKYDKIKPYQSIFIDNSYKERDEVQKIHHIPVFDVDGIDFLLDWRY